MKKNLAVAFLLIFIIAAGIGYAILNAPEWPEHQLFKVALKTFSQNAGKLENQFIHQGKIADEPRELRLNYRDLDNVESIILVNMSVSNNQVTFSFAEGNTAFAHQSIIFEPYFSDKNGDTKQVVWKCIGGSVLIRFRTNDCRLGPGIVTREFTSS